MPDLTPITREEMFLDGNTELTPITREEMILAGVDLDVITRREWFLKKYRGGGGGDITVESLSVTENATYTAPTGKAYSPVVVNVPAPPLPSNAYLLKEVEGLPSDIATFTDGANLPMPKLEVSIEPIQSGSGDPSPTNIRPISGWDEVNVSVSGVNVWDEEWEVGAYNTVTGAKAPNGSQIRCKNLIPCKPSTNYYTLFPHSSIINGFAIALYYDKDETYIKYIQVKSNGDVITTPSNAYYITYYLSSLYGTTYNHDISINYPSTDTNYHAYNGQTYTLDLDGTRYGGTLDVVSGIVTPAPYYASYNGETLTGEWISDRDVYSPNTTPTIGAQVVNIGASGTPVSIQSAAIKSIEGVNNVWCDTGNIEDAEYFSKEV